MIIFKIRPQSLLVLLFGLLFNANQLLAQKAELIIPKGHTTPVVLIDFHEKERWLASSQGNNAYTIWNFDAEKEIRQIAVHENPITALVFHPEFPHVLSADVSGKIISYDIKNNRKRSDRLFHRQSLTGIVFKDSGKYFFTYSDDSTVKKIDYLSFKVILDISFNDKIESLIYSNEKDLLLVSVGNGKLASVNNKGVKKIYKNENGLIFNDLIQYPKNEKYLGVTEGGEIAEIDLQKKTVELRKQIPFKVKKSIRVDSLLFIAGRGNGDLKVLDFTSLRELKTFSHLKLKKELDPYNISLQIIDAHSDSSILFVPDYDYSIIGYDINENKPVRRFKGLTEKIKEIDFSPGGNTLAIATEVNGLRLYDLREVKDQRVLENSSPSYSVDFSFNGLHMAVARKDSLFIYNTDYFEPHYKHELIGNYPNGATLFLNNEKFIKKDEREGFSVFDIKKNSKEIIKIKEAFEIRTAFPKNYFAVKSGRKKIYIHEIESLKKKAKIKTKTKDILDFDIIPDNDQIVVLTNAEVPEIAVYNFKGKALKTIKLPSIFDAEKIKVLTNRRQFLSWKVSVAKSTNEANYNVSLWDLDSLKPIKTFEGLQSTISSVTYDSKRGFVIASSEDGSIKIWSIDTENVDQMKFPASIFPLDGKNLVTMLNNGIYDASRPAMENMHYVQGLEYISLDQIKEKYYEPKLLSKIFGYNNQYINPRSAVDHFELYPEIKLQHPALNGGILGIDLKERGGGIGRVSVFINNKKAKEYNFDDDLYNEQLKYSVEGHPFLKPNEINKISVKASTASGEITSSPKKINYIWNTFSKKEEPKFYALIIGVSDYTGSKLDLSFSSKDANDISEAIQKGASNYFGSENVNVINLNSDNSSKNFKPSKYNAVHALKEISKQIKPQDVFLFYFAGHGVQGKGEDKNYYLLTQEASFSEIQEITNAKDFSISDRELANLLSRISSHKMVMILDACHSGDMINKFNTDIGHLSTKEEQALEKLISETGMHILAGSESGDVSYETSLYGQGLLTYSLLFGMKGEALRDGQYLDVNRLFHYASAKVPELANTVGGVQKPVIKVPMGAVRVDIGEYSNTEKSQIQLISPRPVLSPSSFQEDKMFIDILNIGINLDDMLKQQAKKTGTDFVFLSSNNFSGAYKLNGRYFENSGVINIVAKVYRDQSLLDIIEINESDLNIGLEKISKIGLGIIENDFKKMN